MPFSKVFPSSRSLNLLKKGLESPGKVLEFHLHQRVDRVYHAARMHDKEAYPLTKYACIFFACNYKLAFQVWQWWAICKDR